VGLLTAGAVAIPTGVASASPAPGIQTSYDSTVSATSLVSEPYQAAQMSEIGDQVALDPSSTGIVNNVVVTMEDWACKTGAWFNNDCAGGGTFNQPITLNLYNVAGDGVSVGSLITSVTQTFAIPYRPPADNTNCTGTDAGKWFDGVACHNGVTANVTFNLPNVQVPNHLIYGVAMNTSDYGPSPYSLSSDPSVVAADAACQATEQGCPYDSLNLGLTADPTDVNTGSDVIPGAVYWNTATAANYCDGGAGGVGTMRADLPLDYPTNPAQASCWSINGTTPDPNSASNVTGPAPFYVPAVQINTDYPTFIVSPASANFRQGVAGNFEVDVAGYPDPSYSYTGTLPTGVTLSPATGTAPSGLISGTTCQTGSFPITLTATSAVTGSDSQSFTLNVLPSTTITSANNATFNQTVTGSFQMTATGVPMHHWTKTGALPNGVTLSTSGLLSGTPTNYGTFPITVTATPVNASCGAQTQSFTLTVNPAAPRFTSGNATTATVGQAFSFPITMTGTPAPTVRISGGAPPTGIHVTNTGPGTATLSGTPPAHSGGVYNLTLTATNSSGTFSQSFTLTIDQAPLITSSNHISGPVGQHFAFTITTTGYPKPAITSTPLPSLVTLTDNGNGTATLKGYYLAGSQHFTLTASNGTSPNATQVFTMSGT